MIDVSYPLSVAQSRRDRMRRLEALEADVAQVIGRRRDLIRRMGDQERHQLTGAELKLLLGALDRCEAPPVVERADACGQAHGSGM